VDGARDFRLMNRPYLEAILALPERGRFSKDIFPWIGFKTKWCEYENIERIAGDTKWSFWKLLLYSLDGIIAFSSKPLAIASFAGIVFFLLAMVFTVVTVIRCRLSIMFRLYNGAHLSYWNSSACKLYPNQYFKLR
jgi:hypothetical protein